MHRAINSLSAALHQPVGLLPKTHVTKQRDVVRGVVVGREAVWSNLFLCGNVQQPLHAQRVTGVPDVVQGAAALSGGPDLPGGIGWLRLSVRAQQLVCRVQAEGGGAKAPVNILRGFCVEVPTYN